MKYCTYKDALELAGVEVLAYQEFGTYQGDWVAKVQFDNETFWITDYFGSCSGCYALESDVVYIWRYDNEEVYTEALKTFVSRYLESQERLTSDEVLERFVETRSWDSEAEDVIEFIKNNA